MTDVVQPMIKCAKINDQLLRLAGSIEQASEHPLAAAIVEAAQAQGVDAERAARLPIDYGARCVGDDRWAQRVGGQSHLMTEQQVTLNGLQPEVERLQGEAKTAMVLAVDGAAVGRDRRGRYRQRRVRWKRSMRCTRWVFKSVMITGDNRADRGGDCAGREIDRVLGRGAARRQGCDREAAASASSRSWRWWATASTMRRRWRRRMSASRSAPARISRSRPPT